MINMDHLISGLLNQSCFLAVLQSNQITIKLGTAEVRLLNWALLTFYSPKTYCILKHLKCHGHQKWYLQGNRRWSAQCLK